MLPNTSRRVWSLPLHSRTLSPKSHCARKGRATTAILGASKVLARYAQTLRAVYPACTRRQYKYFGVYFVVVLVILPVWLRPSALSTPKYLHCRSKSLQITDFVPCTAKKHSCAGGTARLFGKAGGGICICKPYSGRVYRPSRSFRTRIVRLHYQVRRCEQRYSTVYIT